MFNGTTQLRKYDLKGNQVWTLHVPRANATNAVIFWTSNGLYLAGGGQTSGPIPLFVSRYDSGGVEVWSRGFGNSTGEVTGVYAGPSGIYSVGWVERGAFLGQKIRGNRDGFMVMYDEKGNRLVTDEFGSPGGVDLANGVSVDGNAVYVAGSTGFYNLGFVRKHSLLGNLVQSVGFSSPDAQGVYGSSIATDASVAICLQSQIRACLG